MNSPFEKDEDVCEYCDGLGEIEESCSCSSKSPQYECPICGNCGSVTKPCPQCNDDYYQDCYDEDHRDDYIDEEAEWGGMDNERTY